MRGRDPGHGSGAEEEWEKEEAEQTDMDEVMRTIWLTRRAST
jgi:hypothetical protein